MARLSPWTRKLPTLIAGVFESKSNDRSQWLSDYLWAYLCVNCCTEAWINRLVSGAAGPAATDVLRHCDLVTWDKLRQWNDEVEECTGGSFDCNRMTSNVRLSTLHCLENHVKLNRRWIAVVWSNGSRTVSNRCWMAWNRSRVVVISTA